jgi:hypothetical protein
MFVIYTNLQKWMTKYDKQANEDLVGRLREAAKDIL